MIASLRRRRRSEGGFTLVELLLSIAITSIIMGAVSGALILLLRTPPKTVAHLTSSASAFQTGSTFADDISSAGPESGQLAVTRNTPGCGGTNSVVRAVTRAGSDVEVRSYTVSNSGSSLERRTCRGADQAAALAQPNPEARTVVADLDPAPAAAPTVTCRASAVAAAAPETAAGDKQCRLVSMTVTTATNLVFTVDGRRNTVQTPLTSPPAKKQQCTLGTSADTFVAGYDWGLTSGAEHEIVVQARTGSYRLNAYLKADLLSGCLSAGEPTSLPGGKRLTSATLSLTLLREDTRPQRNDHFRLVTLPSFHAWDEDTLNFGALEGCGLKPTTSKPNPVSIPCEEQRGSHPAESPDFFYNTYIGKDLGRRKVEFPVLGAVESWYDGSEVNQGWSLDRGYTNLSDGK